MKNIKSVLQPTRHVRIRRRVNKHPALPIRDQIHVGILIVVDGVGRGRGR